MKRVLLGLAVAALVLGGLLTSSAKADHRHWGRTLCAPPPPPCYHPCYPYGVYAPPVYGGYYRGLAVPYGGAYWGGYRPYSSFYYASPRFGFGVSF